MTESEKIFEDLSETADKATGDEEQGPTEIESMCVECQENGVTKLLLTKIPHYREVILMSFRCEHCGYQNNEIQSGGPAQERGIEINLHVTAESDLSRQVVKSDHASIVIPEIDLEIPVGSQKGAITTVEGILERTISGLEQDQPVRKHLDPDAAQQIEKFVDKINRLRHLDEHFHLVLRDPSGNSFVENPLAPLPDPARTVTGFSRSKDEDHALGIYTNEEIADKTGEEVRVEEEEDNRVTKDEVLRFPTNCPECNAPAETNMKVTDIPHFKEVVIMATVCDSCGHKTNEVKSGGGIEQQGSRISLKVTDVSDMSRDVLKSETCTVLLPDLDFEMGGYALGGRFTTVEGLMNNIIEQLENNPMMAAGGVGLIDADSASSEQKTRLANFVGRLKSLTNGKQVFTLVLDDPTGNSYLQNVYAPENDPNMSVEKYERSFEQNEALGLNDMRVENYGEHEEKIALKPNVNRGDSSPGIINKNPHGESQDRQHLAEIGANAQTHLFTKDDKSLLSPTHAAVNSQSKQGSRRVSNKSISGHSNSEQGGDR